MVRDLTGRRFGHLTASREVGSDPGGRGRLWECRCDCGTVKTLPAQRLPKTISCGCQKARGLRAFNDAARAFYAAGEWDCSRCGRHLMADQFSPTYTDRGHPASRRTVCKLCESVRKYGLNGKTWEDLLALQGGTCASCGEVSDRWCVDHDHGCCPGIRSCGECLCGAFAHAGELEEIRFWYPEVAAHIDALSEKVRAAGHPEKKCVWGWGGGTNVKPSKSGIMCSSCDSRFLGDEVDNVRETA